MSGRSFKPWTARAQIFLQRGDLVHRTRETQGEIDYFWERLSADPKAEQCAWLKDRYGLSWQINPTISKQMPGGTDVDKDRTAHVTKPFLKMKKFDIEALKQAYEGEK